MIKAGDLIQERYQIVRPLGSGGFGSVFLATDTRLGNRNVAIKYFATSHMTPEELEVSAKLFQSEANTLARLNHPNLAPVLDYFEVDHGWMLVMGYVPGDSLATLQKRLNGPFGEQQVVEWAIELCSVLDYLHRQQPPLVFRDLKPSNIMRTPQGKVMLIDFGIVRTFKEGQHQDTVQLGTPGYAPPEQQGGQSEPRSDIYALGATMFVLLTNERLTSGLRIPPVRTYSDWVSPALNDLIQRMTELRPQERPNSMAVVQAKLEKIKADPYETNSLGNTDDVSIHDAVTVINPSLIRPNTPPVISQPIYRQPQANHVSQSARPSAPQPYANQPAQPFTPQPQIITQPAKPSSKVWLWSLLGLLLLAGLGFALRGSLFAGSSQATIAPNSTTLANNVEVTKTVQSTATAMAVPTLTATPIPPTAMPIGQVITDAFDGSTLNQQYWQATTNNGTITINNGAMLLDSQNNDCFPTVRTLTDGFELSDNFDLTVTFRYGDVTIFGTGFMFADAMPDMCSNKDRAGTAWGGVWQDLERGMVVEFHRDASSTTELKDIRWEYSQKLMDQNEHTFILQWRNGRATYIMDGQELFRENGGAKPTVLWFGNPSKVPASGDWTQLYILNVDVSLK